MRLSLSFQARQSGFPFSGSFGSMCWRKIHDICTGPRWPKNQTGIRHPLKFLVKVAPDVPVLICVEAWEQKVDIGRFKRSMPNFEPNEAGS